MSPSQKFDDLTYRAEIAAGIRSKFIHAPFTAEFLEKLTLDQRRAAVREFQVTREVAPYFVLATTRLPIGQSERALVKVPMLHANAVEKSELYNRIRLMAEELQAVAVITVSECWFTQRVIPSGQTAAQASERARSMGQPRDDPNREELVQQAVQSTLLRPRNQAFTANIFRPRNARPYLGPWRNMGAEATAITGDLFDLLPYLHSMD